jgi:hypothetical protein
LESQTGEYLFSTLQKTKTHTSWSKTKERQSGQVSESISECPERGKNAAKRDREKERVGGEECNRENGWERNVISDGENERT